MTEHERKILAQLREQLEDPSFVEAIDEYMADPDEPAAEFVRRLREDLWGHGYGNVGDRDSLPSYYDTDLMYEDAIAALEDREPDPVGPFRRAMSRWIDWHNVRSDVGYYSADDWKRRGEKYGEGAPIHMTIEGPLNHILNYPESEEDDDIGSDFYAFADDLGYRPEMGYAWSVHFYPKEGTQ